MTWETVPLGQVVDVVSGYAFDSAGFGVFGDLPVVRIRDVIPGKPSTYFTGAYDHRYLIDDGDLLIGMDGGFNRGTWRGGKALLNQRVCKVTAQQSRLDARYLYHALPRLLMAIEAATPFVTVKHLSVKTLQSAPVRLPPLSEQRRIAAILDEVDAVVQLSEAAMLLRRRTSLTLFGRLFGDPFTDPRWSRSELGSTAEVYSDGPFGSNLKSADYVQSGARVVRLQNIGVGEFRSSDVAFISLDHFERLKKHSLTAGDVVIGTLGDPNLRACRMPEIGGPAINKADCIQYRPRTKIVNPAFAVALLNHPATVRAAESLSLGQTRARISMGRLRHLSIPLPPIELQREFEALDSAQDHVVARQSSRLDTVRTLFSSLQHRAFRGEL